MKKKQNAKQRREKEDSRRKSLLTPVKSISVQAVSKAEPQPPKPVRKPEPVPQQTPEEETKLFLEYLDRYDQPARKDDLPGQAARKQKGSSFIQTLNIKGDMPLVEEALNRLRIGLQEMRAGGVKAVRLIHGYGSTGRGGKIRPAVREELASMKRKGYIKDFIPGEDFGPMDAASRKLAEQCRDIPRDPDYGGINHGITIVIL